MFGGYAVAIWYAVGSAHVADDALWGIVNVIVIDIHVVVISSVASFLYPSAFLCPIAAFFCYRADVFANGFGWGVE